MTAVRNHSLRSVTPRSWLNLLLGALTVVLSLPGPLTPTNGLDPGWQLGLSWANQLGLQWGPEIDFTYGPLGYVIAPVPLNLGILVTGIVLQVLWLGLGVAAFRAMTSRLGFAWSWLLTFGALHLITAVDMSILQLLVVLLIALLLLTSQLSDRARILVAVLLGVLASMALLTKFSTGSIAAGVAVVAATAAYPWVRGAASVAGGLVAGLLVPWILLGQSLSDLGLWFVRSFQIAAGYGSAMGVSHLRPGSLVYGLFSAWVVAVIVATWLLSSGRTQLTRAASTVIVAASSVGALVSGTIRFDLIHVLFTSVFLTSVTVAIVGGLSPTKPKVDIARWLTVPLVGLCAVGALVLNQLNPQTEPSQPLHLVQSARGVARAALWTVDADARNQSLESAVKAMRREDPTPARVSEPLRDRGVQGDPWDVGRVWALGLDWRPVPVFQTYSAYTPALDEANRNALVGPSGPTGILRTTLGNGSPWPIDGRNGLWDSPEYQLAVLCNFELAGRSTSAESLIRSTNVCAPADPIKSVSASAGQPVAVPSAPGRIVVASITADLARPIWDPLLPGRHPLRVSCGANTYRVAQGSPTGPLIVSVPGVQGWRSPSRPLTCGSIVVNADADVTFSELDIGSP
ncbi:MAG: hypothetical protein ACOYD0_06750 [Candidatus Nanopelagicales bacterium]